MSEINLLVVEPSHTMRLVIQYSLERLPVRLFFAKNSEEALATIDANFDLVLCSSRLPSEDGYAFCGVLKGKSPHLKAILLMQKNEIYDFGRGSVFGIDAQIEKPFVTQQLVELVCQQIGMPAPNVQAYQVFNRIIPLKQPGTKTKTPNQATVSEIFQLTATPTPVPISMISQVQDAPKPLDADVPKKVQTADSFVPPSMPSFNQLPPKAKPMDQRTLIGFSSAEELKALFPQPEELNNTPPQPIQVVSPSSLVNQNEENAPPPIQDIYQSIPPPPPPPVVDDEDVPPPQPSLYSQKSYQAVSFDIIQDDVQNKHLQNDVQAYVQDEYEPSTSFGYVPPAEQRPTVSSMPALNRDLMPTVSPPKMVEPEIEEIDDQIQEMPMVVDVPIVETDDTNTPALQESALQQSFVANMTPEYDAELIEDEAQAQSQAYEPDQHQAYEPDQHQAYDQASSQVLGETGGIQTYANHFLDRTQKRLSSELYARIAQNLGLEPSQNEAELQQMLNQMIWQILPDLAEAVIKEELSKLLAPKNQF
jgi:CheY-like chemotaxis protein